MKLPKWGKWEEILNFFKVTPASTIIDAGACRGDFTVVAIEKDKKLLR